MHLSLNSALKLASVWEDVKINVCELGSLLPVQFVYWWLSLNVLHFLQYINVIIVQLIEQDFHWTIPRNSLHLNIQPTIT